MRYGKVEEYPTSAIAQIQAEFMNKVYAWMAGGLGLTALTAWYVASNESLLASLVSSGLMWLLFIGELILVFSLSARIYKMQRTTAAGLFLLYALLNGLTLAPIVLVYTAESIQETFAVAAAMFAALSVFGYFTKKSLSAIGSFLFMGLIGLILASFLNIFFGSSALRFAITVIGVVIFAGLTAWDTQKLKEMAVSQMESEEIAAKGAIMGALALYLDFINLFLFLLRLFGDRE